MYEVIVKPKLNQILKERGLTQTSFSQMTGIPQAVFSRFDRAVQRKDEHLFLIAHVLELKAEDLFEITITKTEKE